MKITFNIELTNQQRNALLLVLIEQIRNVNATQQFMDVLTDSTVTLHDLLHLVSQAPVIEASE